jgi:hypothetical protein
MGKIYIWDPGSWKKHPDHIPESLVWIFLD